MDTNDRTESSTADVDSTSDVDSLKTFCESKLVVGPSEVPTCSGENLLMESGERKPQGEEAGSGAEIKNSSPDEISSADVALSSSLSVASFVTCPSSPNPTSPSTSPSVTSPTVQDRYLNLQISPTLRPDISVYVDKDITLKDLKLLLAKRIKLCSKKMRLLWGSSELHFGTLCDNGLVDGARLRLLPSLETGLAAAQVSPTEMVKQALETIEAHHIQGFIAGRRPLFICLRTGQNLMMVHLMLGSVKRRSSKGKRRNRATSSHHGRSHGFTTSLPNDSSCHLHHSKLETTSKNSLPIPHSFYATDCGTRNSFPSSNPIYFSSPETPHRRYSPRVAPLDTQSPSKSKAVDATADALSKNLEMNNQLSSSLDLGSSVPRSGYLDSSSSLTAQPITAERTSASLSTTSHDKVLERSSPDPAKSSARLTYQSEEACSAPKVNSLNSTKIEDDKLCEDLMETECSVANSSENCHEKKFIESTTSMRFFQSRNPMGTPLVADCVWSPLQMLESCASSDEKTQASEYQSLPIPVNLSTELPSSDQAINNKENCPVSSEPMSLAHSLYSFPSSPFSFLNVLPSFPQCNQEPGRDLRNFFHPNNRFPSNSCPPFKEPTNSAEKPKSRCKSPLRKINSNEINKALDDPLTSQVHQFHPINIHSLNHTANRFLRPNHGIAAIPSLKEYLVQLTDHPPFEYFLIAMNREINYRLGRHYSNHVYLESQAISRLHAVLCFDSVSDHWFIMDNLSSNKTFINELELPPRVPHQLEIGDLIQLGKSPPNEKALYRFQIRCFPPKIPCSPLTEDVPSRCVHSMNDEVLNKNKDEEIREKPENSEQARGTEEHTEDQPPASNAIAFLDSYFHFYSTVPQFATSSQISLTDAQFSISMPFDSCMSCMPANSSQALFQHQMVLSSSMQLSEIISMQENQQSLPMCLNSNCFPTVKEFLSKPSSKTYKMKGVPLQLASQADPLETAVLLEQATLLELPPPAALLEPFPQATLLKQVPLVASLEPAPPANMWEQVPPATSLEQAPPATLLEHAPPSNSLAQAPLAALLAPSPPATSFKQATQDPSIVFSQELIQSVQKAPEEAPVEQRAHPNQITSGCPQAIMPSSNEPRSSQSLLTHVFNGYTMPPTACPPTKAYRVQPCQIHQNPQSILAPQPLLSQYPKQESSLSFQLPTNKQSNQLELNSLSNRSACPIIPHSHHSQSHSTRSNHSNHKVKETAAIGTFHNHRTGVFGGTFTGKLKPELLDEDGRPRKSLDTVVQILTDLIVKAPATSSIASIHVGRSLYQSDDEEDAASGFKAYTPSYAFAKHRFRDDSSSTSRSRKDKSSRSSSSQSSRGTAFAFSEKLSNVIQENHSTKSKMAEVRQALLERKLKKTRKTQNDLDK